MEPSLGNYGTMPRELEISPGNHGTKSSQSWNESRKPRAFSKQQWNQFQGNQEPKRGNQAPFPGKHGTKSRGAGS